MDITAIIPLHVKEILLKVPVINIEIISIIRSIKIEENN